MTDVRFVQMTFSDGDVRGDRETSIERSGVLFSQTKDVRQTRRITFSLLVFDPSYEAYKAEYIKSWDELTAKNPRWRVKPVTGESAEQMHRTKWIHEVSAIEEWRRTKDGKRMLEQIEQARRRPKKPSNATVIR
jgi:hypothetical protein